MVNNSGEKGTLKRATILLARSAITSVFAATLTVGSSVAAPSPEGPDSTSIGAATGASTVVGVGMLDEVCK